MKQTMSLDSQKTGINCSLDLYNYAMIKQMQKQWKNYSFEKYFSESEIMNHSNKIHSGNIEVLSVGVFKKLNKPKKKIKL